MPLAFLGYLCFIFLHLKLLWQLLLPFVFGVKGNEKEGKALKVKKG
jgi:hypothetical protein